MNLTNAVTDGILELSRTFVGDETVCGYCTCFYSPAIEFLYGKSRAIIYMRCPKCGKNDWTKERVLIDGKLPLIAISS